ncbi:MAG: hypothetical protein ACNA8K_10040 [Cyclonatronaceae bacterium]
MQPLIIGFYEEQLAGLRLPGWGELIPVQLLRSVLFLIACLPVLMVWHGSTRSLWLRLGASLFILMSGVFMFQSYWLPAEMRVFHSLRYWPIRLPTPACWCCCLPDHQQVHPTATIAIRAFFHIPVLLIGLKSPYFSD